MVAVSAYPTRPVPDTVGDSSIVGSPSAAIGWVAGEVSETVPPVSVALHYAPAARVRRPLRPGCRSSAVAPLMFSQLLPYSSQRCHWYS